jgi:hypothetical protein
VGASIDRALTTIVQLVAPHDRVRRRRTGHLTGLAFARSSARRAACSCRCIRCVRRGRYCDDHGISNPPSRTSCSSRIVARPERSPTSTSLQASGRCRLTTVSPRRSCLRLVRASVTITRAGGGRPPAPVAAWRPPVGLTDDAGAGGARLRR